MIQQLTQCQGADAGLIHTIEETLDEKEEHISFDINVRSTDMACTPLVEYEAHGWLSCGVRNGHQKGDHCVQLKPQKKGG